ncbi:hypothetical protein [Streptomyces jeddahensis]|uniref:DUF305 domain-containing protein n=1 Tax=Streptomyces jeddahensis TaxID=1716141 RepID=A0A177HP05_9ACTN|nr:hypothetical protein [Streptomyces jeddahensis]OAH12741.1 hypothetical protein STSP_40870 [Streptomyces jeddahensis]
MGVPVRDTSGPVRERMLGIYLNDHVAGATGGVELVRRMVKEHRDTAYGPDLEGLATEIAQDRHALLRLLADLDVPARRYKMYGAWLAEKAGRVKPNGRLRRRSGLTVVIELEALRVGVEGKALLWRSLLAAAARDSRLDARRLQELLDRARTQTEVLDSLHSRATSALLSPGPSAPVGVQAGVAS